MDNSIQEVNKNIAEKMVEEISPTEEEIQQPTTEQQIESIQEQEVQPQEDKYNELMNEIDDFQNSLQNEFNSFLSSKMELEETDKVEMVSTGIDLLDSVLGGGVPLGRFVVFAGYPGGGKSTLAAAVLANLQEKYLKDCLCLYLDSEQTMSKYRLKQLGVTKPELAPKSGVTVEKVFDIIEGVCLFKQERNLENIPAVIIWDSIANTPTEKDMAVKDVNEVIGLKARILSTMLPKIVKHLQQNNISLIAVNQLREKLNIGLFSSPNDLRYLGSDKDMPGGQAIKFNAAQLLMLRHKSDLKSDQYGFDGARVVCVSVKNKFFTPNISIDLALNFKSGFDNFWTNYLFLVDKKYIKAGAWNKLVNYDKQSFRTKEAKDLYDTDKMFRQAFDELVKLAINEHIIQKYS